LARDLTRSVQKTAQPVRETGMRTGSRAKGLSQPAAASSRAGTSNS